MRRLFRKKNRKVEPVTRYVREYKIALLPDMVGKVDFYTDGRGLVYIVEKDCDFGSKDEFIKMGLVKVEDTDWYRQHIGHSRKVLSTPWYLVDVDNYNVLEISKDKEFD